MIGIVGAQRPLALPWPQLKVTEAVVSDVKVRFLSGDTGKPAKGKTKESVVLRQMGTQPGRNYSVAQVRRGAIGGELKKRHEIGDAEHAMDTYAAAHTLHARQHSEVAASETASATCEDVTNHCLLSLPSAGQERHRVPLRNRPVRGRHDEPVHGRPAGSDDAEGQHHGQHRRAQGWGALGWRRPFCAVSDCATCHRNTCASVSVTAAVLGILPSRPSPLLCSTPRDCVLGIVLLPSLDT